jgi:predicted MPP superfamily phosphohydrolase
MYNYIQKQTVMSFFLLSFLLIYGSFHLYFFLKARAAFTPPRWFLILLSLFLLMMIMAPILVRISEGAGLEQFAMIVAYSGYTWMGIIFLFVAASLVVDTYRVIAWLCGNFLFRKVQFQMRHRTAFYIPVAFALAVSFIGAFEAWDIRLEKVTLAHEKIPDSINGLRIVQISDVHLGLIVRHTRLEKILAAVRKANPDILVSTGDLVDGQINRLEGLAAMLQEINPPYGKYAVTGNHEFYAGLEESLAFTEDAGFTVLRNKGIRITDYFNIVGMDDRTGNYFKQAPMISEHEVLEKLDRNSFTLLLKHRPEIDRESLGLFDLQLSGHTHKGQIFPFNIITLLYFPVHWGCLNPVDHCYLYVSRGSGTWGPPIRFLSPPEVTLIELIHEEK